MSAIATLKAMLGLDSSQYLREMDAATRKARGFESDFKRVTGNINSALGALGMGLSFAGIIGGIKSVLSWADNLSEAASQVGMLTGEMAALNQVALQNGVNLNDVSRFVSKLQNNILDAATGNEKLAKSFADVGLDASKLNGMLPVDQLRAVMQAAVESGRPLTALSEIVGDKLGPSFVNLATALQSTDFSGVNSGLGQAADNAGKLNDRIALGLEKIKQFAVEGGVALAGMFDSAARFWTGFFEKFSEGKGIKESIFAGRELQSEGEQSDLNASAESRIRAIKQQQERAVANKAREADIVAEKAQAEITKDNVSAAAAKKRELEAADAENARAGSASRAADRAETEAIEGGLRDARKSASEKLERAGLDESGRDAPEISLEPRGLGIRRTELERIGGSIGGGARSDLVGQSKQQLDEIKKLVTLIRSVDQALASINRYVENNAPMQEGSE